MDGMDMGGMDMSDEGMFTVTNKRVARTYWYIIAACTFSLGLKRLVDYGLVCYEKRLIQRNPSIHPCRPRNPLTQTYATITAMVRELSAPQLFLFTGRISKYFNPPSLGRLLLLLAYWIMILIMLWSDTIIPKSSMLYAYKWEKVGYRAAWVSVSQLPFIYLLSCKFNPISIITGISYERLNWLHRWAARTMFLTVIVHWSFFFREWSLADFVKLEISIMPMVKYGFGAFAVIGWMILSGFGFFRQTCYEVFVLQHIAAAAVLLWLVHVHVPSYAQYNVWMSVGFVAFDWGTRIFWGIYVNLRKTPGIPVGYPAQLDALPGKMTRITINDVKFGWKPGQHVFISIPSMGFIESHPFTISNAMQRDAPTGSRSATLHIKAHGGFTGRLLKRAERHQTARILLSGPWGTPPSLEAYETVVLVAGSTGITFIFPLLQSIISNPHLVRRLVFHWIIKEHEQLCWFERDLVTLCEKATASGLELSIGISITSSSTAAIEKVNASEGSSLASSASSLHISPHGIPHEVTEQSSPLITGPSTSATLEKSSPPNQHPSGCASTRLQPVWHLSLGRPDLDDIIRPAVEKAWGETAVVGCGGRPLMAAVRNYVAGLSDERAVHKGTGAQGIMLFTEMFEM